MGEHRVPLLGTAWRRNDDPALSRDPRVRAVVGALATLPQPEMNADFKAELRAQLVAITPRIISEAAETRRLVDVAPVAAEAARTRPTPQGRRAAARHTDSPLARLRGIRLGRPLTVAASVLVAFALLLGGAVVMSRKALPGDALYGLKRAGERFELATAGSAVEKAKDHLDFATNRAQEAQSLAKRNGTASLITSTLQSEDGDVRAAAQLLGTYAVQHASAKPLALMSSWAPAQIQRLQQLAGAISDPGARSQALSSLRLVQAAEARAAALATEMGCGCLSTANHDALGPVPCTSCRAGSVPQQPNAPGPHQPTHHAVKPGTASAGGSSHGGGVVASTPTAGSTGPTAGGTPSKTPLPVDLPSLPTGTPTLPISGNSCSVTLSLPLIGGAGVSLCSGVNVQVGR